MSFAAALTDWKAPPPPGLSHPRRYRIYRNNVASALIRALAVRYPAVERLVGAEFFAAMAGDYALSHLPRSPVLSEYGRDFPDFIARYRAASGLPYLSDTARLESAWFAAYHAADAVAAGPAAFAAVSPERLPMLRLRLHPAAALVTSPTAIFTIWQAQRGDGDLTSLDLNTPQTVLVARPDIAVEVTLLSAGEAPFFTALLAGEALAAAVEAAGETLDIPAAFTRLIASRIATSIIGKDAT